MSKLQTILNSVAVLAATVGSEFIHSAEGQTVFGAILAAIEASGEIIAAEEAAKKPAV